ncbi:hypothetical protein BD410DRAFT_782156 [Rickenella mellea]|uniref:1-phosphatidylinositol-3-phosphate 5-kinase n=1 Tax=Rickenella mellea TaxID=50990 RepID=A0A4Y7QL82_9AGAM|nr:hypothetical protein BD410DRAFT_782156 [Rickenella mellea]
MESPQLPNSPQSNGFSSRSGSKVFDDLTSLTSYNPFSEEDEHDQSSYTLVTSLLSRMKNTLTAPLTSSSTPSGAPAPANVSGTSGGAESRRTSNVMSQNSGSNQVAKPVNERPHPLTTVGSSTPIPAPPLVSRVPVVSETPTYVAEADRTNTTRGGILFPAGESNEGGLFGTSIPGFPIQDDARSIHTTTSFKRSGSVSKVIRKIRGEGLSRDYWMDDDNCKECYDCKSVFTTWRRKHHCRICGQIFCSRCASNIIKGYRFGHDGMVRVCNLCLEKLHDDDDDDDDHRSIISNITSPYPYQYAGESYAHSLGHHPQSPFAASQLFGRSDEPFNLFSIAETRRQFSGSDGSAFGSRPMTPGDDFDRSTWVPIGSQAAPFRRGLADDDKDSVLPSDSFTRDQSPIAPRSATKTPVDFPITVSVPQDGPVSSIQFPGGSPEQLDEFGSPRAPSLFRNRLDSESDVQTPFLRSRVQSRLGDFGIGEPGWRTRRESTAYAQELNLISMFHLRIMLRQMLTSEGISNTLEWEETLLKLALRIARDLTFTAHPHREGADMDVRRYVKIKKIPGGAPRHSEYVDGPVITKNVAHKQMSRNQRNPRIMFITFPLEFQRVEGQYMHFGHIVRQEKEYLGNLASRIAALRPHIVLVEKSVSRLALDAFVEHNIAVARTVKDSAIRFVARMTQGDVFSSMDKLALEPRLGHCGRYRIQTFDHPLIPGRRKTYMRFEGCSRDLGCTIILRGGDLDHLRRVKKVTRFLTFIVRNLKLETHLWKDSVITLPHLTTDAVPFPVGKPHTSAPLTPTRNSPRRHSLFGPAGQKNVPDAPQDEDLPDEDAESLKLSRRIQQSLEPYLKTFISASATLRFLPPYPIRRMKELDDELNAARRAWEDEIIAREEKVDHNHSQDVTITSTDDIKAQIDSLPSPGILKTPSPDDASLTRSSDYSTASGYFDQRLFASPSQLSLNSINQSVSSLSASGLSDEVVLKNDSDIALESNLSQVKFNYDEQRRVWEWYLRKNPDDFQVDKYQCISLLEFTLPIDDLGHHRACFPPQLRYITFYGENDCTLGQFVEKAVHTTLVQFLDPKAICAGKGCSQPLARHCKVYVHNESRLVIHVEQWDGEIISRNNAPPAPDLITTWSACRVCGSATPFIPVSEEMQRYSFAKFLELHFYPADVQLVQGAGCAHNIYQHHIRYFALRGMTVRCQSDPVVLYEAVYPSIRIRVRPESLLHLKNIDYERLLHRNAQWYMALIDDLKLINIDAATGDEETDIKLTEDINILIDRAEAEKTEMTRLIHLVYRESSPVDTLALNQVRAHRQDKIVAWQQDFDRLPKPRTSQLSEKDSKRTSTFGSVRAMWPRRYELLAALEHSHLPSSSISEAEEGHVVMRRVTGDSFTSTSSASEASESETSPKVVNNNTSISSTVDKAKPDFEKGIDSNDVDSRSDPDSDSTIGAGLQSAPMTGKTESVAQLGILPNSAAVLSHNSLEDGVMGQDNNDSVVQLKSKLPRRSGQHPTVAELVKRYQDFLPSSVSTELATTAFPPPLPPYPAESDHYGHIDPRKTNRHRHRPKGLVKRSSISDFEQSYAANIAPRYLTHRRPLGYVNHASRIPAPAASSFESRESSRRPSPDKRPSFSSRNTVISQGEHVSARPSASVPGKHGKAKPSGRMVTKEKGQPNRPSTSTNPRTTFRRQSHTGLGNKVSNIARHFERINKDNEKSNRRYAVIRGRRARPVASARATVEVFDSLREAIKDDSDGCDSSSEADDEDEGEDERESPSQKPSPSESTELPPPPAIHHDKRDESLALLPSGSSEPDSKSNLDADVTPAADLHHGAVSSRPTSPPVPFTQTPSGTPPLSDLESPQGEPERHSTIMKALSGFWPQHHAQIRHKYDMEIDDPMANPEHIFRDCSMVVRTDEPTSIIALALNSPQYREMLAKSRADKRQVKEPKLSDGREAFMPDDQSVSETSTWGVVNIESADDANPTEDLRVASSKLPWAISFESGGLTITCTILYPEQFDALRRTYDCEKSLIESLARCVKWDATGGKSGSAFLKARDDRFIAKELSRAELETMETFGPAYFDYMSSAVTANRPTLLAKVFGCYKLVFRKATKDREKPSKSKSTQMNLLVMENLFYERRFSKIFDLKGSTRNRHVQSTGRENEVLLDENLVETAHLTPFYVREHSKRILRGALYNDSKFLADINVMDYSLLVGVDSKTNELVVGIVDYIRTYTWDKKLESWVKESAFLGGAGKGEPTIVTPKQYRQRFISAMERYFPMVPDRWMKQKDAPEEEGNSLLDLWPDW